MSARRQLAVLLLVLVVAGCTLGDYGPLHPPLPSNPPDLDRVSKAAIGIFTKLKLPGSPEMSRLRPAHVSSPADWMFCLRSDADDIPRNYALFVRNNDIVDYRLAVQIDACAAEQFDP